jgi:hypothetical protein
MATAYSAWFPPCLVIDGTAIAPAFVLAVRNRCWQDENRQDQADLRTWESEGGNRAPRGDPVQASLFAAPGQDIDG